MLPGHTRTLPTVIVCALLVAGCLPSSCSKTESRAVSPTDSLSRAYASGLGVDTLLVTRPPFTAEGFEFPRTAVFSGEDLYVSDGKTGAIWRIRKGDGTGRAAIPAGSFDTPFLAGFLSDTSVVFEAGTNEIALVWRDSVLSRFPLDIGDGNSTLRYVSVDGSRIAVKSLDEKNGGHISWYSLTGERAAVAPLVGNYWEHAGLLKPDGDSLLSLRGYLPTIDVYYESIKVDSVNLFGFDSPMLARTRSYQSGASKSPPLLSTSAAACGDSWYLLNVRPGWIRIDRYNRAGRLLAVYTQPDPSFDRELLTTDLAVHCSAGEPVSVAVAVANPRAEIRWFTLP